MSLDAQIGSCPGIDKPGLHAKLCAGCDRLQFVDDGPLQPAAFWFGVKAVCVHWLPPLDGRLANTRLLLEQLEVEQARRSAL